MPPLKEFAGLIKANLTNLAVTQARLLTSSSNDQSMPQDDGIVAARKLLNAVIECCETQTFAPLLEIVDKRRRDSSQAETNSLATKYALVEIECLGQTLNPVVTSLEAGKFFWQSLSEVRATLLDTIGREPKAISATVTKPHYETNDQSDLGTHKLHESKEKFHSIVELTPLGMHFYELQTDGRLVFTGTNLAGNHLLGVDNSRLIGKTIEEAFPLLTQTEVPEQFWQVAATGQPWQTEYVVSDHGQIQKTYEVHAFQPSPGNLVAFFLDITERKRSEATFVQTELALHESEERFRRLAEASVEGIVIHEKGIIFDGNPTFATMFGYEPTEIIGMQAVDFLTPESGLVTQQHVATDYEKPYIVEGLRKDRTTFMVEITGKVISYKGHTARVTSLRDVTERLQMEQQIRESLERRSRQVQTSTEIAQEIAAAPALAELFQRVINLVQDRFGYYHAHIYTLAEDDLIMQEGTGDAGQQMKAAGHMIALAAEQSLVARAARTGQPVLVPDVAQEPGWLPNPLLPETQAELSVPIKLRQEVLGVLDVQHESPSGLNKEDQILLLGLCGQIAVAIESRRLLEQMEATFAEREQLLAEVERRAYREQTIREITEKMRAAISLEQLVQVTAKELGERLSAGHAVVDLGIEAATEPAQSAANSQTNQS